MDRRVNKDGKGKYALIKLREIPTCPNTPEELAQAILDNPQCVDFGEKGTDSEFFVVRLKDKYAVPALQAYARAAQNDDSEWALQVISLARDASNHPNKKQPDQRPLRCVYERHNKRY